MADGFIHIKNKIIVVGGRLTGLNESIKLIDNVRYYEGNIPSLSLSLSLFLAINAKFLIGGYLATLPLQWRLIQNYLSPWVSKRLIKVRSFQLLMI